ncbi:MAG: hypothetical protein V4474_00960 [Patescibacteria group bacterium]
MRTKEAQAAYDAYKHKGGLDNGCRLCDAPALQTFKHWKIVENKFPYDLVAGKHDMIVPVEHCITKDVSAEAWAELQQIRADVINKLYDFWIEATPRMGSIPDHLHAHLVVLKEIA